MHKKRFIAPILVLGFITFLNCSESFSAERQYWKAPQHQSKTPVIPNAKQRRTAPPTCLGPTFEGTWNHASHESIRKGMKKVNETGVNLVHIAIEWGWVEKDRGDYDWSLPDLYMQLFAKNGHRASVVLTSDDVKPEDLGEAKVTDTHARKRHAAFVKAFVERYQNTLDYLWIGNEVNDSLDEMGISAQAHGDFVLEMRRVAKTISPSLKVGTIIAYPYEDKPITEEIIKTTKSSDLVGITFYPEFLGTSPKAAQEGFDLVERYSKEQGVRYAIIETGWSTQGFGSDLQDQDTYVKSVFQSLKTDIKPNRDFVCWWGLNDTSLEWWQKVFFSVYGLLDWLESLGLLENDGTPKPAWNSFVQGMRSLK